MERPENAEGMQAPDERTSSEAGSGDFWHGWPAALAAAGAIYLIYLFMIGQSTLWDRDEPRFARATVEMVESGNYLYPTFDGQLRTDKPILIYWLMSLPVRLFGATAFACRFWSPLGTAISCLLLYAIGRKLFDPVTGLLAMMMYGTLLTSGLIGTAATADAVMVPLNLGALLLVALALAGGRLRWRRLPLMALLLGGAMLTKSPFGLLPLLAVGGFAVFDWFQSKRTRPRKPGSTGDQPPPLPGRPGKWFGLKCLAFCCVAAAIGAGLFLAWFIPANTATGGELLRAHLGKHILQRATSPLESHGSGGWKYFLYLPYYVPVIVLGLFPWTLYLPAAIRAVVCGKLGRPRGRAFLLGWFVPIFLAMSLIVTKFPHYLQMALPAMVLALAGAVQAAGAGESDDRGRLWMRRGLWLFAPVAAALVLTAAIGPWLLPDRGLVVPGTIVGVILLLASALALRKHLTGQVRSGAIVLIVGMVLVQLAIAGLVAPAAEHYKVSSPIAQAIKATVPNDVPVGMCDYQEPSLVFYLGRPIEEVKQRHALRWLSRTPQGVLVITREALDNITRTSPLPAGVRQVASQKGINYSDNAKWVEVVALLKSAPAKD